LDEPARRQIGQSMWFFIAIGITGNTLGMEADRNEAMLGHGIGNYTMKKSFMRLRHHRQAVAEVP